MTIDDIREEIERAHQEVLAREDKRQRGMTLTTTNDAWEAGVMPNPPTISLAPGIAQSFRVVVTANNVQPDGSNPGQVDTTTALIIEPIQGTGPNGTIACIPSVDGGDNRRVICTPGIIQPGNAAIPWSFRVRANGRTGAVIASGTTNSPTDVSGVSWDGITPA